MTAQKSKLMNIMKNQFIMAILIIGLCLAWMPGYSAIVSQKKKILFVDSYHEGYPWSTGILKGVKKNRGKHVKKKKS